MKYIHLILGIVFVFGVVAFTWYSYAPLGLSVEPPLTDLSLGDTTKSTTTETANNIKSPAFTAKELTYTNFNYGFTFKYPKTTKPQTSFSSFYILSNLWRANATPLYRGNPVLSFVVYRVDNNTKYPKEYPLYYSAEVRLGVSSDVTNCYTKDDGYTNQKVVDVSFGGVSWKRFSFADAAMMQYKQGESYRTIHNKQCFVLEQIKTGSNYQDEDMVKTISDTDLNAHYLEAESLLRTFRFTK
jgi:hypothetical protein